MAVSLLVVEDDEFALLIVVCGFVGEDAVLDRACAADDDDACARALDSKAAARAA